MWKDARKRKKIVTWLLLLVFLCIGLSGWKVRSVPQYKQEQKKLAQQLFVSAFPATETPSVSPVGEQSILGSQKETPSSARTQKPGEASSRPTEKNGKNQTVNPVQPKEQDTKDATKEIPSQRTQRKKKSTKEETRSSDNIKKTPPAGGTQSSNKGKEATASPKEAVCTIGIRCHSLLENKDSLQEEIRKKIPADGWILKKTTVKITSSDTVYSVLRKVCKASDIQLDAVYSHAFSTEYVQGIGELYEKEAGDMSGWLYTINGSLPQMGASVYHITSGDTIEWVYTCDGTLPQ